MNERTQRTNVSPSDALRELADRAALQLVADAMRRMVGGPVEATGHVDAAGNVSITINTPPRQRALGPAPAKRRGRPAKVVKRAGVSAASASSSRTATSPALADRRCRKCFERGTAVRVAGTERTVKCSRCGHAWDVRGVGAQTTAPKPRGSVAQQLRHRGDDECGRCTHGRDQHELDKGRCLVPRCVCTEFYA